MQPVKVRRHRARALLLSLAGVTALSLSLLSAAGADNREEQLKRVRTRLKTLQSELNATKERRDAVREEIDSLERKLVGLQQQLRDTETKLGKEEQQLTALHRQLDTRKKQLSGHFDGIARQVRAQYAAGGQEQLKLLLNQDDPATTARMLAYHRYIYQARLMRIESLRSSLADLRTLETSVQEQQRGLLALRDVQREQKNEFETNRIRRGQLLASLDRRVASQSRELGHLKEDEARLTRLLQEITTAYADIPIPKDVKGAFGSLKGKLGLPTKGKLVARYGDTKPVGNLKWRGLFLATPEGSPIRAVSRGRVVYADWLRGFGLLLILEHGDGYMTLYGHNQSLSKQAGEWVNAGDVIAQAGTTGDAPQSGLYFEIRHNGTPHDPLIWCRAR